MPAGQEAKVAPARSVPAAGRPSASGLLAQEPQPFPGAGRDIFRFRGGGPPRRSRRPKRSRRPSVGSATAPPPPPPTPEEILQAKVAGFTFLGFLDKGGVKTVFLS